MKVFFFFGNNPERAERVFAADVEMETLASRSHV
jgi:hypothetical protein